MKTKKSSSADLESGKSVFFKTGLILTLVMVLMAFQYRAYDRMLYVPDNDPFGSIIIEEIPITRPKPPAPPPPPKSLEVVIVPNEQEVENIEMPHNVEADNNTLVGAFNPDDYSKPEVEVDENIIFERPEIMPEFPGGLTALFEYLGKRLKYPPASRENNIQGAVYIGFVIEKDGSVTNVHLLRGIGGGSDEEAMRVVGSMPKWIPGRMGTQPVRVKFSLPVRFKLE